MSVLKKIGSLPGGGHVKRFLRRASLINNKYYNNLERLYDSYEIIPLGAERNLCAQPPAGPPKTNFLEGEAYFPENWSKSSNFLEIHKNEQNLQFWCHHKNLSARTDFSKTHKQTQRMHSWINLALTKWKIV